MAYPYCFGAKHPVEFAENDCETCDWFSPEFRQKMFAREVELKGFADGLNEIEIMNYTEEKTG